VNVRENLEIGLEGLARHKLRSFLTSLGIIFGVAAVIAMLSIGEGARREALEQIRLLGVNNILVRAHSSTKSDGEGARKVELSAGLVALDGVAIREVCPLVKSVVPQWEKATTAQAGSLRSKVALVGTTPEFLEVFGYALAAGTFLRTADETSQANVCVLSAETRAALFRFESPIGKMVKVDDQWFSVIGVLDRQLAPGKAVEKIALRDPNRNVYIPITTAREKLERWPAGVRPGLTDDAMPVRAEIVDQLTVHVVSEEWIDEAATVIRRILERRHYGSGDYEVIVPELLVRQSQKTQKIFNVVMGAIAGISLLVGGIGIMNIMLASVWERTREIGLRRALGARQKDVLAQFLLEASFLSLSGGVTGIGVGYVLTRMISAWAGWRTVVSPLAVLLAFGVSASVGVAFGYYPARRAALQNPIESLRYE